LLVASVVRLCRPIIPHPTAAGKVMLAFTDAGLRDLGELSAFTEKTITDRDELAREVAAARDHGFAEAAGEREPDLAAVAAPVLGRDGQLAAIVGLQGPAWRFTASRRRGVRPALLEAATAISLALGGA
jgi:DNA-binding IclR family transcriptional regulator